MKPPAGKEKKTQEKEKKPEGKEEESKEKESKKPPPGKEKKTQEKESKKLEGKEKKAEEKASKPGEGKRKCENPQDSQKKPRPSEAGPRINKICSLDRMNWGIWVALGLGLTVHSTWVFYIPRWSLIPLCLCSQASEGSAKRKAEATSSPAAKKAKADDGSAVDVVTTPPRTSKLSSPKSQRPVATPLRRRISGKSSPRAAALDAIGSISQPLNPLQDFWGSALVLCVGSLAKPGINYIVHVLIIR